MFISYSHDDVVWVQRFRVLLGPLLQAKRLRLWIDTDIRPGDAGHPKILDAIERSAAALVLVSADFLASDFIMEHELPALIRHGVRLVPVLVGSCVWEHVPELAGVQWCHDPGRDGPLNLVETRPAERDRRLTEICKRLVEVAPIAAAEHVKHVPAAPTEPAEEVPAGSMLGDLDGVPQFPPGYIARDELRGLVELVISVHGGAVGVTGQAVGPHGQGGIGKSVLAAALARDERIRRRFPDGIHWVTVGEKADLLAVQLDLLARLGDSNSDIALRTCAEATQRLTYVLWVRRVLLVVDDVRSDAAAQAFQVTRAQRRVLYTARDASVLAACGARPYEVRVLSPAQARALAAGILGAGPDALPAAADQAFAGVGRVALAVALVAAAVRGGQSWDQVAAGLIRHGRTYADHPYANTFNAMRIAVVALAPELADALLGLTVFPADTQIPAAAIARYWSRTRGADLTQTRRDLTTLAAANVLRYEQDNVGFHDLQYNYLLLHAPALARLHTELVNAYRAALPADGQWWRLPAGEPYIWDHLVSHLRAAGHRSELSTTVTNPAYLVQRVAASGTHAVEADLAHAAEALPTDALIAWWRHWMARHADLLTGARGAESSGTARIAPTMLAWLTADQTIPDTIDPQQLAPLLPVPFLTPRWGLTPPTPQTSIRAIDRNTKWVRTVAWSPGGARLAIAGNNREIRVWNPTTGHIQTTLVGHSLWANALAWSPDGARLASASSGGKIRLWDPTTGHTQTTMLIGQDQGVRALAWSPGGARLAIAGNNMEIRIWDPTTGRIQTTLTGHPRWWANALAWSPDGARLASGTPDGEIRVWDVTTGHTQATLIGHTQRVNAVAWSPDGARLASVSADREIRVWDPTTGHTQTTLPGLSRLANTVAWSPDGARLASASYDGTVVVHDLQDNTTRLRLLPLACLAWSTTGIAVGGANGSVVVLELNDNPL